MARDPYLEAKERVKEKKGFYGHLTWYLAINIIMFFVVLFSGGRAAWLVPASMWGIGLAIHYINVFGFPGFGDFGTKEWEEREIEKELAKKGYEVKEDTLDLDDELELKEFKELRKDYRDDDLV